MFKKILYLGIVLSICGNVMPLYAGDYEELQKIVASDRAAGDYFGCSVSISGDYAIVGAEWEEEDALGNNTENGAGSAYIFMREGTSWIQQAKLVASDRDGNDRFGKSVSISGDYAIVGAFNGRVASPPHDWEISTGSAYIFKREGTSWFQQAKLVASDRANGDYFGYCVSISGDYAIVGAYQGDKDALGNNTISDAGSAYIFKREDTSWFQQAKLVASDRAEYDYFGRSVSISGDYAIVGAYFEDEDAFGSNTLHHAGSAYIFMHEGTSWFQLAKIVASDRSRNGFFGESVSISGNYAIVGTTSDDVMAGSAYIFFHEGTSWTQQAKLLASDRTAVDFFGYSVSISGDYAIVGAILENENASGNNTISEAGSAYIFKRDETSWSQHAKIVASDRDSIDHFGYSVSISDDYAIVGAYWEDEDAFGSNTLTEAGSAYIYDVKTLTSTLTFPIETFILSQNKPNPLNPTTTISYELPEAKNITLQIFDLTGRLVETLYNGYKEAGHWEITWDASMQSSGIYIYRLTYGDKQISRKMLLLK